jgi:hypothetical protein
VSLGNAVVGRPQCIACIRHFAIQRHNQLLHVARLQDSQRIYQLKRCDNDWRVILSGHDSAGTDHVIRGKSLADLVAALCGLAQVFRASDIYITTTLRFIDYYVDHRNLQRSHQVGDDDGWIQITIRRVADPLFGSHVPNAEELQGITFYVTDWHFVKVFLGDGQGSIDPSPTDRTSHKSVMIPRTVLTYPLAPLQHKST